MDQNLTDELMKLEEYLVKQGRDDLVRDIRKESKDSRLARLLQLSKHKQEVLNTKAIDQKLQDAKDLKKELEAPYREQIKANDKITRFVSLLMKDEGNE